MNLTYEVNENGYTIFNDGKPWIVQDGYFPYPGATVEESAQNHINAIIADNEASTTTPNEVNEIEEIKEQNAQIILALVQGGLM